MSKLNPFDYIKSINEKTGNMMDISPDAERDYVPFVVNRGLSFSADTILYANEMNCKPLTDRRMQYDYLYHSVRKRRRYDKWVKPSEMDDELVEAVMLRYQVGRKRAMEYIRLLDDASLDALKRVRGGSNAK
jgi:hypothetical protein